MAEAISRYESRELLVLPEDVAEAALSRQACDMAEEATEKHIFAAFGLKTVIHSMAVIAALERCATQNRGFPQPVNPAALRAGKHVTSVIRETGRSGLIIRTLPGKRRARTRVQRPKSSGNNGTKKFD
jgi:hypothetical protein